ncbi:Manganese/iron superoxide dismutase [Achaetomium macrosporum]|uniref:Manganese/iron superoxide dismutase n=1 Tax=Achaetomium macrosporum TaxID=79813 RepID=A0AAN7HEV3_9PEZI|nr:Manganese/iron superoxide dismutase [Achaetomium macrosporum]
MRPRLRIPLRPRLVTTPARSSLLPLACQSRSLHALAPLDYNLKNEASQNGIPEFLSREAFNISWTQYQTHLLERLNALTGGTGWESRHVKDIMLGTAREPDQAPTFNYASMIHNNHFFFKHLSPVPVQIPDPLRGLLEKSFGSIETLRQEMIYTAASMFGPGFVWLVKTSQPGLPVAFKVLVTYAAGSPYPAAHWRRQDVDMSTAASGINEAGMETAKTYLENTAYGAGKKVGNPAAKRADFAPGGTDLLPVLCLNTWEHVWLWDYGFGIGNAGGGKLGYAEKWWNRINWERVQKEANIQRLEMSGNTGSVPTTAASATA